MLLSAARIASSSNGELRNVAVESFAIHCRALIVFFYAHKGKIKAGKTCEKFARLRGNDVVAIDYVVSWEERCPEPTEIIIKAKSQADKHVAHILTNRRGLNQPGSKDVSAWDVTESAGKICDVMACFLGLVPDENFDHESKKNMTEMIQTFHKESGTSAGYKVNSVVSTTVSASAYPGFVDKI
ncbi:MAG: hypothetical protein IT442_11805 [Phycisphaeraceae bacterium]|nr:hypothetical protein [Phycisphaeraceae bacterium]